MATGIVRAAIAAVMEKTDFESPRSNKMKQVGQQILDKACHHDNEVIFDGFCSKILILIQENIQTTASQYKSNSSKREKLWCGLHKLRLKGILPTLWKEIACKLDIDISDPLLEQSLYQELFEMCVCEYFTSNCASNTSTQSTEELLTDDELNVMRYVCGYVIRTLVKRYEKKSGDVYTQYVECLGEFAVEEGECENDVMSYTRKWFEIVNRGGLYPLNNKAFTLFVEIEKMVRICLPKQAFKLESDHNMFKRAVHDKILQNDEVQFHWALLSQVIDSPDNAELLLMEIIKLWVTVRGYSMIASWMEVYKKQQKKNSQKSTGLRKSLTRH